MTDAQRRPRRVRCRFRGEGDHAEPHATVVAMEKGAKQMQQSQWLRDAVTDATDHVRLATQPTAARERY